METANTSVELQPAQNALSYGLIRTPVDSQTVTSVILDEGVFNTILQDMRHFTVRQSWYIENGERDRMAYKHFYFFYFFNYSQTYVHLVYVI